MLVLTIIIIIEIIELYLTRVKHIDYWSPSSFHNGPPTTPTMALLTCGSVGPFKKKLFSKTYFTLVNVTGLFSIQYGK